MIDILPAVNGEDSLVGRRVGPSAPEGNFLSPHGEYRVRTRCVSRLRGVAGCASERTRYLLALRSIPHRPTTEVWTLGRYGTCHRPASPSCHVGEAQSRQVRFLIYGGPQTNRQLFPVELAPWYDAGRLKYGGLWPEVYGAYPRRERRGFAPVSRNDWREPTHCPLCGREAMKRDRIDPELLECSAHGRLSVHVLKKTDD